MDCQQKASNDVFCCSALYRNDKYGFSYDALFYCVKDAYKYVDHCVFSVYNIGERRNTGETKGFD